MARYIEWCPSCGSRLDSKAIPIVHASSFSCPSCEAPLQIIAAYNLPTLAVSIGLALLVSLLLRFHGLGLVLIATAIGLALYLFIGPALVAIVEPPRVRLRQPTDFQVRFPNRPRE